jgi:hypothetical protein
VIDLKEIMPISFLEKEPFTGSYQGMRYRMEKADITVSEDSGKKDTVLRVYIWPQPFCFDKTDDSKKTVETFAFSPEGLAKSVDWMNTHYINEKKRWSRE